MKHIRLFLADARRHQGLALIIVLSMLALATIVILAFLSVADTENKATNIYSASQASRRFADTAVNIVISQIRSGSERQNANTPVIHATQPGAVRKYNQAGRFLAGYKLFSDKDMIYLGDGNQDERNFVFSSEPPADWNEANNLARYVDLNEPVIKGVASDVNTNTGAQIYFPIIDPRAGQNISPLGTGTEIPVEGFSYELTTALAGNNIGDGNQGDTAPPVLKPSDATGGADSSQLRLAMPVQWLYLLKDGAVGYLNADLQFQVLDGSAAGFGGGISVTDADVYGVPSETNPIVGRVAFWADDETCKININTASEPTFSSIPIYYHERDHRWGDFPPASREYQRFPGHPATVALSTVLYPNPLQSDSRSLDTYGPNGPASGTDLSRALEVKERIYNLMPRINIGGSRAGTRTFSQDDYRTATGDASNAVSVDILASANERLYSSVDELLFSQEVSGGQRVLNVSTFGTNSVLFNKTSLERTSAFLTAHSRGSEINLFGLPRIAMWPISKNTNKRTGFDNLMEFCSRLGAAGSAGGNNPNIYIFQREYSRSIGNSINGATHDISLPRNKSLLKMLDLILDNPFPVASTADGATPRSFNQKLTQNNKRQLLVSMFDYIRSTNLYDSYLVPQNRSSWPSIAINNNWPEIYRLRDNLEGSYNTYTPGVVRNASNTSNPFEDRYLPGHGQVTPSEFTDWQVNSQPVRGFGRFFSVSEIGLQFICTADGQPDMYSWRIPQKDTNPLSDKGDYLIPVADPSQFDALAQGASPLISGGRTALRVREDFAANSTRLIDHEYPAGFVNPNEVRLTNVDAVHWRNPDPHPDNYQPPLNSIKRRFYSNYPPLRNPNQAGRYGTTPIPTQIPSPNYGYYFRRHPGYDWRNWNWTLDFDTPLQVNQKRIQALLHIEFFCPAVAYTEINPDYTILLSASDISSIEVSGRAVFNTTQDVVLRSEKPLFETDANPEIGGFASFRNVSIGRRVGGRGNMPEDFEYDSNATTQVHSGLVNMELLSSFFTVNRNTPLEFKSNGSISIKIYDHHVLPGTTDEPVQVINFNLTLGTAPTPEIVTYGSMPVNYTNPDGTVYNHPGIQAPRWWCFNRDGCLGRVTDGGGLVEQRDLLASLRGRFYRFDGIRVDNGTRAVEARLTTGYNQSVPGAHAIIYTRDPANYRDVQLQTNELAVENPLVRIGYGPKPANLSALNILTNAISPEGLWDRPWHQGSDTVRTLQPAHGDARLIAIKKVVPASDWTPHRLWNDENEYMAHNFSSYSAGTEAGFDRGTSNTSTSVDATVRGLPSRVTANAARSPDAPHGLSPFAPSPRPAHEFIQRYYDFDDSDPGGRIGPFINKVDEGNYSVGQFRLTGWPGDKTWRSTYFRSNGIGARFASGSGNYFTPNRMVASPVVMGSLPSRVWDPNGNGAWTNLLFRPYVSYSTNITGAPVASDATHPGAASPPDHYLLDLFWMPVVEPYAISESLSTAGKVNLNYQMLPFTHIRRATAVHAAMKGELMAALPNADYDNSKGMLTGWGPSGSTPPEFRSEALAGQRKYWHRGIVIDRFKPATGEDSTFWWRQANLQERVQGTLRQFEERFTFGEGPMSGPLPTGYRGGLFRTASQLCEIHLIPSLVSAPGAENVSASGVASYSNRSDTMSTFWAAHCSTGDNTREKPYNNLYSKFTTRSNTFRVHVRAQSIRKALRSVDSASFNPEKDLVVGEFRGSFLLERYIDQADLQAAGAAADYASASNPFALKPLESYYRFRVLESKRFAP